MKTIKFAFIAVLVVGLMACDEFFSTSWGTPRNFDWTNVDINSGNVDQWKDEAVGNPGLANELGKAINDKLENSVLDNDEKSTLMNAAVDFAWIGSEIGDMLLTTGIDVAKDMFGEGGEDGFEDSVENLVTELKDFSQGEGFKESVDNLSTSVGLCLDPATTVPGENPAFFPGYEADPGNVDKAVLILVAGLVGDVADDDDDWAKVEKLLNGFEMADGKIKVHTDNDDPDPTQLALAAYFNLLADNPDLMEKSTVGSALYDKIVGN